MAITSSGADYDNDQEINWCVGMSGFHSHGDYDGI